MRAAEDGVVFSVEAMGDEGSDRYVRTFTAITTGFTKHLVCERACTNPAAAASVGDRGETKARSTSRDETDERKGNRVRRGRRRMR